MLEHFEACADENYWILRIKTDYPDFINSVLVVYGRIGEHWLPNIIPLLSISFWKWN